MSNKPLTGGSGVQQPPRPCGDCRWMFAKADHDLIEARYHSSQLFSKLKPVEDENALLRTIVANIVAWKDEPDDLVELNRILDTEKERPIALINIQICQTCKTINPGTAMNKYGEFCSECMEPKHQIVSAVAVVLRDKEETDERQGV